jgi:hypothetical protein
LACGSRRKVGFDADDRLYAGGFGGLVEVEGAVIISVVADANRWHALGGNFRNQWLDSGGTIEH